MLEYRNIPLLIREKDIDYQFYRVELFQSLLSQYPFSRNEIIQEAKIDIPPLLRGQVWAAILGIKGDFLAEYELIDRETETPTDRQVILFLFLFYLNFLNIYILLFIYSYFRLMLIFLDVINIIFTYHLLMVTLDFEMFSKVGLQSIRI